MTISVVASLPKQTQVATNDSAASSTDATDDATGSQDFLNLLLSLGQQLSAPAAALIAASPESAGETDSQVQATDTGITDPASLFAALGILPQDVRPDVPSTQPQEVSSHAMAIHEKTNAVSLTPAALATTAVLPEQAPVETQNATSVEFSLPAEPSKTAKFAAEANFVAVSSESKPTSDRASESPAPVNTVAISMETQPKASNVGNTTHDTPLTVHTPVRTSDWNHDFSQKIVWMASNEKQSAQITLNPEHMGPIEVSLSVDKGNVSASFTSASAEVREAIETALPRLREMFASAGIELGQTNVSAESFRQPTDEQEATANSSTRSHSNGILTAGSTASVAANTGYVQRQGNGLVDIFA